MVEVVPDLLVAMLAFGLFLAAHWGIWNRLGADRAGFVLLTGLWGSAVAVALALVWFVGYRVHALTTIAVAGLVMAAYCHLYTGMLRSVSLRILFELAQHDGRLTSVQLRQRYNPQVMLAHRLRWLVSRGWLAEEAGAFRLTAEGARVLAVRGPLVKLLVDGPTG